MLNLRERKTTAFMDMAEARVIDTEQAEGRRVSSAVALALLEVMRAQDLPEEVLSEEDLTETLPRRFGLSDVVDAQIRRYRGEVKRRRKVPAGEVRDLFQLVLKRPDARALFYRAGRRLAGQGSRGSRLVRVLPRRAAVLVAGRQARARVTRLFGGPAPDVVGRPFTVAGRDLITARGDPSGAACALLTGLFDEFLERYTGLLLRVVHGECEALGQSRCVWLLSDVEGQRGDAARREGSTTAY